MGSGSRRSRRQTSWLPSRWCPEQRQEVKGTLITGSFVRGYSNNIPPGTPQTTDQSPGVLLFSAELLSSPCNTQLSSRETKMENKK